MDIIVLHGWGSSSKRWEAVKSFLEAKGHKVYIPDLPGFGENPPPARAWSVEDYAEWVKKWSEEEGLADFCLVGYSFGGGVAAVFAAKYPSKVLALVLIGAAIIRRKTAKKYVYLVLSKIGKAFFSVPVLSSFRHLAQRFLYKLIGVNDYVRATLTSQVMKETFQKTVATDLQGYLSDIAAPTLLIWGDKDKATPVGDASLIRKQIAHSRLEIIEGAGHRLHMHCPEKVAAAIITFLLSL